MNPRTRKSAVPAPPPLTDAALDAALRDDTILPSSGFAASVMAAVERESAAPAALAFPWKRALPGLIVAVAVLALLAGIVISAAVRAFHAAPGAAVSVQAASPSLDWRLDLQPLLHSSSVSGAVWPILALVLAGITLLLCRRLIASH
ncbi:MAG TPA: hypothetical protein VHZ09_01790 [Acidobacteriaceae bacterium]|jgi:hypothetical protein|nr:hypothetical protein [Acidobacteriaceae bacterium]